jgi:two-component system, sensor histidine kinase and response regulator
MVSKIISEKRYVITKQSCVYSLALLFYFSVNQVFSQVSETDSLNRVLRQTLHDTDRCNILAKLTKLNREKGWEEYYHQLKPLATKNYEAATSEGLKNFYLKKIHACIELEARDQRLKGNLDKAIALQKEGSKLAQKLKLVEREANAYNSIGSLYYRKGDAFNAIAWFEKSLTTYKKLGDSAGIMKLIINLGALNNDFGDLDQAIAYFRQGLSIGVRLNDVLGLASSYSNLANALDKKGKPDSALVYYLKAIQTLSNSTYYEELGTIYCSLGKIYMDRKDLNNVLVNYQKGLNNYIQAESKEGEATGYCYMASIFDELKQTDKALAYALKGLAIGKEMDSPDIINRAAYQLAIIYAGKGEYKKAYDMQGLYLTMKDSLKSDETENFLMKAHYKYEYGKKMEADSLKILAEKQIADIKFEKQENEKWFLYVIIALVVIVVVFIFYRYRLVGEQKGIIEVANKDLERQHVLNQKIFSVISHDFRGPMLSLSFMLDKFKQKSKDDSLNTYVKEINTEVNNANIILNNLLNWARTEINIKGFEKSTASVNTITEEISAEFKTRLEDKKIQIECSIPSESNIQLPPDIMRIILRNLISNAIKYSQTNSKIEILFNPLTSSLSIKDAGIGILPDKQKQLFKKEVDTELGTSNEEGFGMGLYIVSELLYKYSFKISVVSNYNKGSLFVVQPK